MPLYFRERTANRELTATFGLDVAETLRTYVQYNQDELGRDAPVRSQEMYDRIKLIIGGTLPGPSPRPLGSPGGAGSLDRLMPMCDPQVPSLFADVPRLRVVAMEGHGSDRYGLGPLLAVPPIVPDFPLYHGIEYEIPFSARPYAVLPNDRMVQAMGEFYDVDGSRKRLSYYPEWLRFVQKFVDDVDSRVSASVGSAMKYRVPSDVPANVDGSTYPGIPDMVIPDQAYKLRWFQVPLRYLESSNSYLVRYKGFINQWPFLNKVKGALLYMGAKVVRTYTPPQFLPTQQPAVVDGFQNVLNGSFYAEPLVDLELNFIFTARRRYAPEAGPGPDTADPDEIVNAERPNNNWVDGPHNWMPHFHSKRFFYSHAATVPDNDFAKWVPYYLSVPHQILFQDPDVSGVVVNL